MKKIAWVLLAMVAMVGCTDNFKRDNPYDPEAPAGIQAPASICGYVVSSRDAQPLDGAEVRIVELGLSSTTQADGQFRFDSLAAGNWTLEVSVPEGLDSYLSSIRRIALEPGTTYECPPSGQEVPEVQTIVLRRRPDAPRIIDLSADDDGLILTFAAEAGLDFDRFDLRFESVFIGGGNPVTLEFSSEDVDVKDDVSQVYLATLRPFQNGTPPGLSATDTYNLSVRAFDSGLASTFSETVRYAHRLEFTRCAYNQPDTVNNELCAPLDGSLPEALDAQPTEIDVVGDDYLLVKRDDCTVTVWETVGAYLGCFSFATDLNDGLGAQCTLEAATEDSLIVSGNRVVTWMATSSIGGSKILSISDWLLTPEELSSDSCLSLTELGGNVFRHTLETPFNIAITASDDSWSLLYNDRTNAALYENGEAVWDRPLNDSSLAQSLSSGAHKALTRAGDYLFLRSRFDGASQKIALIDYTTGVELDTLAFGLDIVDFEMLAPMLFVAVLSSGDLVFIEFSSNSEQLRTLDIAPNDRALTATDAFWISSPDAGDRRGFGVLGVVEKSNGIVNLRALGYQNLAVGDGFQWIVESENRGMATDVFPTPKLKSGIDDLVIMGSGDTNLRAVTRTASDSTEDVRLGIFEFSP